MLRLGQKKLPDVEFQLLDCRDINQLDEVFDGLFFGFGLPYLTKSEAKKIIFDFSNKLNNGGLVYISFMEDKNINSRFISSKDNRDQVWTNYYEKEFVIDQMDINGLELIHLEYPKENGKAINFPKDLILIFQKR